jgi:hypothetical protein
MQFKPPSWFLLMVSILLACTLAEAASIPERHGTSGPWIGRRGLFSSLGESMFSKPKRSATPTLIHRAANSEGPATSPIPRKCNIQTCGSEACPPDEGTDDNYSDIVIPAAGNADVPISSVTLEAPLAKRSFYPMVGNGATEKLANKKGNKDASPFQRRNPGFTPFDGVNRKSVMVVELEGCTVIAAFSSKGMVVAHPFESSQPDPTGESTSRIRSTRRPLTQRSPV